MKTSEMLDAMAAVMVASAKLEHAPLRRLYKDCEERMNAASDDHKEQMGILLVWIGAALELQQHYVNEILPASSLFRDDLPIA